LSSCKNIDTLNEFKPYSGYEIIQDFICQKNSERSIELIVITDTLLITLRFRKGPKQQVTMQKLHAFQKVVPYWKYLQRGKKYEVFIHWRRLWKNAVRSIDFVQSLEQHETRNHQQLSYKPQHSQQENQQMKQAAHFRTSDFESCEHGVSIKCNTEKKNSRTTMCSEQVNWKGKRDKNLREILSYKSFAVEMTGIMMI
jgi:hypothetical protein